MKTAKHLVRLNCMIGFAVSLFVSGMNGTTCALGAELQPPRNTEICDELNRLWQAKAYAEADAYVKKLHAEWGNYVPVALTWIFHAEHFGSQLEESVARAKALQKIMQAHIELESPVFMEELRCHIRRTEDIAHFFQGTGETPEKRDAERNPLHSDSRFHPASYWVKGEDSLYYLAPEAIWGEGVTWRSGDSGQEKSSVAGLSNRELSWRLGVDGVTLAEKASISHELVRQLQEEGGAERIVRELIGPSVLYTYPDLVASLVASPKESIPALVSFLDAPAHKYDDKMEREMAIWALVRLGRADGEVLRALEDCRAAHPNDELGDYVARAIDYLTRRVGK